MTKGSYDEKWREFKEHKKECKNCRVSFPCEFRTKIWKVLERLAKKEDEQ